MNTRASACLTTVAALLASSAAFATNPLVLDQFTADPTARVFEGRVYVYPSHDIHEPPDYKGRPNWFVMEDYHVFSSDNLTDWTDHGVILSRKDVPWADQEAYAMWAPDAIEKGGKYYFYFPAMGKRGTSYQGFRIGVAIADSPTGPFRVQPEPIAGVQGIDPGVFIDKDGGAYMYWGFRDRLYAAKLKDNMLEIEGEPRLIDELPKKGLQEGPFVFERNGIYYFTYPHVENKTERIEYATSTSPLGPFEWKGVIMDEHESGCWTNHHSIVEYRGQWYFFYHDKDLSPGFDKRRSMRAEELFFNADGTIRKITPTLRGVGLVKAERTIQIDRYRAVSPEGVTSSFLDEKNPHAGWKATFAAANSWLQFDDVDFGAGKHQQLDVRVRAPEGAELQVRLNRADGPVIAKVKVRPGDHWRETRVKVRGIRAGVHDLVVTSRRAEPVEVDWIRFR